jgi:SAM-dependent methyltransferase
METRNGKDTRRLYGDLAWTWPIISPPGEYVEESETFAKVIKEHSKEKPKTLLHLGCGGGHNDYTLKKYFDVTGVDISENMLGLARKLNPEADYRQGDMRTVRLGELFDAVIIFDSINYMLTEDELGSAFKTAYEHLKPGGVFLTIPEDYPQRFKQNETEHRICKNDDVEIVFIENGYDPETNDTEYEGTFVYLIRRDGKLEIHTDRHLNGIFELDTWRRLLNDVGFEVNELKFTHSSLKEGDFYPMFVCAK